MPAILLLPPPPIFLDNAASLHLLQNKILKMHWDVNSQETSKSIQYQILKLHSDAKRGKITFCIFFINFFFGGRGGGQIFLNYNRPGHWKYNVIRYGGRGGGQKTSKMSYVFYGRPHTVISYYLQWGGTVFILDFRWIHHKPRTSQDFTR